VPDTPDAPDVVAALQAANARLRAQNAGLQAENAELKAQLAEQAEKIARLERLISRNSGNSSMPPSAGDLPGKKPPERRPRPGGGRKPGKQPRAPGACLAWNDHPDKIIDHFPQGACGCGRRVALDGYFSTSSDPGRSPPEALLNIAGEQGYQRHPVRR
jgi:hypothetical protein